MAEDMAAHPSTSITIAKVSSSQWIATDLLGTHQIKIQIRRCVRLFTTETWTPWGDPHKSDT